MVAAVDPWLRPDLPRLRRAAGVRLDMPLADAARELLTQGVESLVVFDDAGAVGRLTTLELAHAVAIAADPRVATAGDFMADLGGVDDTFWTRR
jgi:predicted transcriptional regulator